MSATEWVLVGGLVLSLVGHAVTLLTSRSKVRVESISAEAAAELAKAQASDLMWENLTAAYRAATDELSSLREEVRELPALRAEVASLSAQLAQFEAIVLTLPDEFRGRFAEVLSKRTARPKASGPGGGL